MSRDTDPSSNEHRNRVAGLWALLTQSGNWPEKADELLAELGQVSQPQSVSNQENETLLSLAVDDALKGVDISTHYPTFFQQMLVDQELRQAFLAALEDLEQQQSIPSPLSDSLPASFDFLKTPAIKPIIEYKSHAKWRLIWQNTIEQIQQIFFSAAQFEPAYRSDDYLEDNWFTLFRNEVEIDQTAVTVVLEAVRLLATPDTLQLQIAVGVAPDSDETVERLPNLNVRLTWGGYDHVVTVTQRGRAAFPPVPLSLVLDETQQRVTSDMRLIVEPAL